MNIGQIYKDAYATSHEAGLQAVWDAAVATVKAEYEKAKVEVVKVEQEVVDYFEPAPTEPPAPVMTTATIIEPTVPVDPGLHITQSFIDDIESSMKIGKYADGTAPEVTPEPTPAPTPAPTQAPEAFPAPLSSQIDAAVSDRFTQVL